MENSGSILNTVQLRIGRVTEVQIFDRLNQGRTYSVNGRALGRVTEQRDLGVHVHSSMKVETQLDKVVKKAFGMLIFIGENIEYRSWDVSLKLYNTLLKPHLKYSSGHPIMKRILLHLRECRKDLLECYRDLMA